MAVEIETKKFYVIDDSLPFDSKNSDDYDYDKAQASFVLEELVGSNGLFAMRSYINARDWVYVTRDSLEQAVVFLKELEEKKANKGKKAKAKKTEKKVAVK